MKKPNTNWKEIINPDEAQRFKIYEDFFLNLQKRKNSQFGKGRALHRKGLAGIKAQLEIFKPGSIPLRGLFEKEHQYNCWVRLSNGSMDLKKDSIPDIRGFAFKVLDVEGESIFQSPQKCQDFLLINHETFGLKNSEPFFELVKAVDKGPLNLILHFIKTFGFKNGIKKLKESKN